MPRLTVSRHFKCSPCGKEFEHEGRGKAKCPSCGSYDVVAVGERMKKRVGEAEPEEEPEDEEPEPEPEEPPRERKEKKPKKEKKPPAGATPRVADADLPKRTGLYDDEDVPEAQVRFASILTATRVKMADAIADVVFQGDPDDPAWVQKTMQRYKVPLWHRNMVMDLWFGPQKAGELTEMDEARALRGPGGMEGMRERMYNLYEMKMLKSWMEEGKTTPTVAAPPASQEQQVPLTDKDNMPVMDAAGKPVYVPASMYVMMKTRENMASQEKPSSLDQFGTMMKSMMDMMSTFVTSMNANRPQGDMQAAAQNAALQTQVALQQAQAAFEQRLNAVTSRLEAKEAVEKTEREYGGALAEERKKAEDLTRELQRLQDQGLQSQAQTQLQIQADVGKTAVQTVAEATKQLRETRKDIVGLGKEQLRQQQLYQQQGIAHAQGMAPVQELTAEQLQADFAGHPGFDGGAMGVDGLDPRIVEPDPSPRRETY